MKNGSAVKHQLQQVVFRHVKKQLRENFRKAPETCSCNTVFDTPGGGHVGVCLCIPEGETLPRKVICDSCVLDGPEQALNCPWWAPLRSKEMIKQDFRQLLAQEDRGHIAARYPDIAALLWVLDTDEDRTALDTIIRETPEEADYQQSPDSNTTQVSGNGKIGGNPV